MRHYIRHPLDIPIQYRCGSDGGGRERLRDIGAGGLCFRATEPLETGRDIHVSIRFREAGFAGDGVVAWCRHNDDGWWVGVRFAPRTLRFALRMVEQLCHMEGYRKVLERKLGRRVSPESAAREWVERYAARFPPL